MQMNGDSIRGTTRAGGALAETGLWHSVRDTKIYGGRSVRMDTNRLPLGLGLEHTFCLIIQQCSSKIGDVIQQREKKKRVCEEMRDKETSLFVYKSKKKEERRVPFLFVFRS